MADDPRVERLLEELLDTGATPEEVCRASPELLPRVCALWQRLRAVEEEIGALFPEDTSDDGPVPTARPGGELPRIPGYDVEALLGRGGMGVVYKARHRRLNRPVALKMLLAGAYAGPPERARFQREAEAVAGLRHANIVAVYDVGDYEGWPYFTMELLEGGSLAQALAGTPQPARQAAALVATLAEAVQVAHRGGIVHRDLKPANILLAAEGTPKIADFGLARHFDGGPPLTLSGARVGTPSYMAPEQVIGKAGTIGPATDIYALGALLYEMLTGRPPFRGETATETERQVIAEEPVPPARLNPKVPRDLETICLKCLRKDPQRRYGSAAALAEDLRRFLTGEPIRARRTGPTERARRWCRRNPAVASLWAALVGVLLAGTAIASYYAFRAREGERQALANAAEADRQRGLAAAREREAIERAESLRWQDYVRRVNLAYRESLDGNVSRALELLAGCDEDLRHWEWSYAERQCHLDLHTFREPAGQSVNGVAFSPDGTRVASVTGAFDFDRSGLTGDLVVRDVATGQEIFAHRDVASGFRGVAFSPDGRWIATGNASALVIWDAATGKEEFRRTDRGNRDLPLLSLAYSPDGRRIIAGYGGTSQDPTIIGHARLWDAATGKELGDRIPGHAGGVVSVAFSPDGREVALANGDGVEVWGLDTRRSARPLRGHAGPVYAVAYSRDGRHLASGGFDRTVRLWDRDTGHEIRGFYGHESFVSGLAFSPDGRWLISAGEDRSLMLWEVASGRRLAAFHGHQNQVRCVAFSSDGRYLASGGADHTVKLWLAKSSPRVTFTGHDGWVFGLAFSPDSQLIASGGSHYSTRNQLMLWDATTGVTSVTFAEESPPVTAVAFRRDGCRLAAACRDGTVRIWDPNTGRRVPTLLRHSDEVAAVAYSPDGRYLASATTKLFNPPAYVREPGEVKLWDADTGREIRALRGHTAGVFDVAFSPDGRYLASACADRIVRIWDTIDPSREARTLRGFKGHVRRVVFLPPDGRHLATAGGMSFTAPGGIRDTFSEVKIWDLATGRVLHDLLGHSERVRGLACSPDGRRLATASDDRTIKLWDTMTGQEVFTLRGHTGGVLSVAFSPDGRRIASGSRDRTVRVWDTSPPTAVARLRPGTEPRAGFPDLPADPFAR